MARLGSDPVARLEPTRGLADGVVHPRRTRASAPASASARRAAASRAPADERRTRAGRGPNRRTESSIAEATDAAETSAREGGEPEAARARDRTETRPRGRSETTRGARVRRPRGRTRPAVPSSRARGSGDFAPFLPLVVVRDFYSELPVGGKFDESRTVELGFRRNDTPACLSPRGCPLDVGSGDARRERLWRFPRPARHFCRAPPPMLLLEGVALTPSGRPVLAPEELSFASSRRRTWSSAPRAVAFASPPRRSTRAGSLSSPPTGSSGSTPPPPSPGRSCSLQLARAMVASAVPLKMFGSRTRRHRIACRRGVLAPDDPGGEMRLAFRGEAPDAFARTLDEALARRAWLADAEPRNSRPPPPPPRNTRGLAPSADQARAAAAARRRRREHPPAARV